MKPTSLSKYGQPLLILGVMAVVAMMLLPLSPPFLYSLLAINMVGALTILLISISISDPLKIATFPSLLMVATLFRLGLNISSTRLILSEAVGGSIIDTFANVATNGNMLVGAIMFLMLTLIQFIVISKGSERVAEVAARFTLDALPGKQMSIDADLRAGVITQEQAINLRKDLHKESKFFGSLDGAMKFVKGDAIAGLLITALNLVGGFFAGIIQQGFTLEKSLKVYSMLTIGDGLVSQIPSLLTAMTAGFIITRVADSRQNNSLGKDIGLQILSEPKALLMASFASFILGMLPGFPLGIFWTIAIILFTSSVSILTLQWKKKQETQSLDFFLSQEETQPQLNAHEVLPLALVVGPEIFTALKKDARWQMFMTQLYPKITQHLMLKTGIIYPELKMRIDTELKQSAAYKILIYDIPAGEGTLHPEHCVLLGAFSNTSSYPNPAELSQTSHGTPYALWKLDEKTKLAAAGLKTLGPEEMILRHLVKVLKNNRAEFLDIQVVRNMLDVAEQNYPELVREVTPRMISIQKLTDVLKRLADEEVSIRDFRLILQLLSGAQPENHDPISLTEKIRVGLKKLLTHQYARDGKINAITIDGEIEEQIRQAIHQSNGETYLAMEPQELHTIQGAFQKEINNKGHFVFLASPDVRRFVKKVIDGLGQSYPVLSYKEVGDNILINSMGHVRLSENEDDYSLAS